MITIAAVDILVIVVTCLACAGAVAVAAVALLRALRRGSLVIQLSVVGCAGTIAMAASVLVISIEMYFSEHDLTVLIYVLGASLLLGIAVAWLVARTMRTALGRLSVSLDRVGGGDVVAVEEGGGRELEALSAQLSAVSAKVEAARAELEQLDSARRRFFAWISHDLRTPLTAMGSLAEAIESGAAEEPEHFVGEVRAQVATMTRMVNDLFDLSKVMSGAITLQTEQVELRDVVSDAVADVRAAAEMRGIGIVERGIAGQVLWADPHHLGRIIVNLLTNAIRHAPQSSDIVVAAAEVNGGRLVLGILDHGAGVAVEDLDRMFDIGWREDPSRGGTVNDTVASGAGIGLSIARGLARAHGGDVVAEITEEGFQMSVVLPYESRE